jgi:hypothetical protein
MNEVFAGLPRFPQCPVPIASSSFTEPAPEEIFLRSNSSMMMDQANHGSR